MVLNQIKSGQLLIFVFRKKMCPSEAALRKKKETEWMLRLRTIYPYGLNMKVTDKTNMDKLDAVEGTIKGIYFLHFQDLVFVLH